MANDKDGNFIGFTSSEVLMILDRSVDLSAWSTEKREVAQTVRDSFIDAAALSSGSDTRE